MPYRFITLCIVKGTGRTPSTLNCACKGRGPSVYPFSNLGTAACSDQPVILWGTSPQPGGKSMLNTMQLGTWKPKMTPRLYVTIAAIFLVGVAGTFAGKSTPQLSNDQGSGGCANLPSFSALKSALATAVATETSGLDNQMWATLVNRDGVVCAVAL